MKQKRQLLLKGALPLILVTALVIYACNKGEDASTPATKADSTVTLVQADTMQNNLILPVGTILSLPGTGPKRIHVALPGAYRYIGVTSANAAVEALSLDITCTCSVGSGCNPFINPQASGCVTFGGCTTCTQTITPSQPAKPAQKTVSPMTDGAVVNLGMGIHFITQKTKMQATPPVFTAMLLDTGVIKAIQQFIAPYQRDYLDQVRAQDAAVSLPPGYRLMPVSVYGHSLLVPVEESITPACAVTDIHPTIKASTEADGSETSLISGYSCSCGQGTGCTYGSRYIPFAGTTHYCSSGVCISCTLHVPDTNLGPE